MKIRTLSTIPLVISFLISLLVFPVLFLLIDIDSYLFKVIIFLIYNFIALLAFSGILLIEIDEMKMNFKWLKRPIYTNLKAEKVEFTDIKKWNIFQGRGADRLIIFLKDNKKIQIDFNNLIDFGKNGKNLNTIKSVLAKNYTNQKI